MVIIPFFALLLPLGLSFDLPSFLAEWSSPLTDWCVGNVPSGRFQPLYAALCCGAALPKSSPQFQLFRHLGLVHLLVVSGLHLLTLEKGIYSVLQKQALFARLSPFVLVVFVAVCGFAPPVTRAYFQRLINLVGAQSSKRWPPSLAVLLTGCLTLCLLPSWFNSLSLQLSWTAALLLCLRLPLIATSFLIYVGLCPYLLPLGVAHPVSLLVTGWAGVTVLIPLLACAWGTFLIPPLQPWSDSLCQGLIHLLEQLQYQLPPPVSRSVNLNHHWLWLYLLALHLGVYFWEVRQRRKLL